MTIERVWLWQAFSNIPGSTTKKRPLPPLKHHVAEWQAAMLPALRSCGPHEPPRGPNFQAEQAQPRWQTRLWPLEVLRLPGQFTVRTGTIFAESRLELHLWMQAAFLMASSKKGVSANQLHRTLGVTLKTAWFLAHRLREAMAPATVAPMGGEGAIVEADTTYFGPKETNKHKRKRNPNSKGGAGKLIVHTLVERGGQARSVQVKNVKGADAWSRPALRTWTQSPP